MNVSKKITVIVPVYNMEDYLRKCINSILGQTHENIELILINDGSKDNSLAICNEYKKIDSRVTVIDKENGGQGSARNMALDIASGDYISFIDSDDWIENDMYEFMLNLMLKEQVELVQCGSYSAYNENKIVNKPFGTEVYALNKIDALKSQLKSEIYSITHGPCDKLYDKKLFAGLRFDTGYYFEDTALIYKLIDRAEKVISTKIPKYYVRINPSSTSRSAFNIKRSVLVDVYKDMETFFQSKPEYSSLVNLATSHKIGAIFYILGEIFSSKTKNAESVIKHIQKEAKFTIKLGQGLTLKQLILLLLILISPKAFGIMYKKSHAV